MNQRQLFLSHHVRVITEAREALTRTNDPVEIAKLNHLIDANTAAVNRLDREMFEQDRKGVA